MSQKKRTIRADESITRGGLTIARFGKVVMMRSGRTPSEHAAFLAEAASQYADVCADIDKQVLVIRDIVSRYQPLNLLLRCFWHQHMLMMEKRSESDYQGEEAISARVVEYIQSLVVSTPPLATKEEHISDDLWDELVSRIVKLHHSLLGYYICRSAHREQTDPGYDRGIDAISVQLEMYWPLVRGERYYIHNREYLQELLSPHDAVFRELFGISVQVFLLGLERLKDSLCKGLSRAMEDMCAVHEKADKAVEARFGSRDNVPSEVFRRIMEEEGLLDLADSIPGRLWGFDLFDVLTVTGWPEKLVSQFSFAPGEDKEFFAPGELAGWPLRLFPVMVKPFLLYEGRYYCFDLVNLLDRGYRMIEGLVLRLQPAYRIRWKEIQTEVSEAMPFRFFRSLLPGCTVYRSVYYPQLDANGRTQWCEADGLIVYDDHLLIVEIKSGAFAHSPPTTDVSTYVDRMLGLLTKPALQANRFIKYIDTASAVTLYDMSHEPVGTIYRRDFRHITACCITLDPFTELAARVDKLKPIGVDLPLPTWSISVDDLRVYSELFDSPVTFAHFLEERQRAAASSAIHLDDELDHLGLYLEHNRYVMRAERFAEETSSGHVRWNGYRRNIDYYYHGLLEDPANAVKPRQRLPDLLADIIRFLDGTQYPGRCRLTAHLLDLSGDGRSDLAASIARAVTRQAETHRISPVSIISEANITVFCVTLDVREPDHDWARNYAMAQMLISKDTLRLLLILVLSAEGSIVSIHHECLTPNSISPDRRPEIERTAIQTGERRLAAAMNEKGKIGRNDKCPCGSNRKFKHCCGSK